jgi:hypothetical protein
MGEHQRYLISTQQSVLSLLSTVRYTFPPKCSITLEYLLFLICSTAPSTSSRYVSNIFQRINGNSITIIPRFNRYSSVIEHLGGNVYVTVDNNDKTDCCVDIRYHWCSPTDYKRYLKPQGLFVTFEQFDKLKKCLN